MRVKWNRHLDVGVRQRTAECADAQEFSNESHNNNVEEHDGDSFCSKASQKTDPQHSSNGFLNFFRAKKSSHRDDLSQCSVSSSMSSVGHLERRVSLPARLKRKFRTDDANRSNTFRSSTATNPRESPRTLHNPNAQLRAVIDADIVDQSRSEGMNCDATVSSFDQTSGRCSSLSADSPWRSTLPLPKYEIESNNYYPASKNPTLTKSASLSTCQPTDAPSRQCFSNFSQSIKSLAPATTYAPSEKTNLFCAARSFFSGPKTLSKKADSAAAARGSSKLKRSVSVSDGRAKSEDDVPDARAADIQPMTRGKWHSVRVRSQGSVRERDERCKSSTKATSKFSELFSNFRSSFRSSDHKNPGRSGDKHKPRHPSKGPSSSSSLCSSQDTPKNHSLLNFNEKLDELESCSLDEQNGTASLSLEKDSAVFWKDFKDHSGSVSNDDKCERLKQVFYSQSETKCDVMAIKYSNNFDVLPNSRISNIPEKDRLSMETFKTFHPISSGLSDADINEKDKNISTVSDRDVEVQRSTQKSYSQSFHAPDTDKIGSDCYSADQKLPQQQQQQQQPQRSASSCVSILPQKIDEEGLPTIRNPDTCSLNFPAKSCDYASYSSSYLDTHSQSNPEIDHLSESTSEVLSSECKSRSYDHEESMTDRGSAERVVEPVINKSDVNDVESSREYVLPKCNNRDFQFDRNSREVIDSVREPEKLCDFSLDTCHSTSANNSRLSDDQVKVTQNLKHSETSFTVPQATSFEDMFYNGISTLDGTIVLTEDRAIFCDSIESRLALITSADPPQFKLDSCEIRECLLSDEISDPSIFEQGHNSNHGLADRDSCDSVVSPNRLNETISSDRSNEPCNFNESHTVRGDIASKSPSVIDGVESSSRLNAVHNEAIDDVATIQRDAGKENTIHVVESVEKRLTSRHGLDSRESVSLERCNDDEPGKEVLKMRAQHSLQIESFTAERESNPGSRVRWSDTLQSFPSAAEEGSHPSSDGKSALQCYSISPSPLISFRHDAEDGKDAKSDIFVTDVPEEVCEADEMISGSTSMKSAICDISGAIAELQNAITSTFGISCEREDKSQVDILPGNIPSESFRSVDSCYWLNPATESPLCYCLDTEVCVLCAASKNISLAENLTHHFGPQFATSQSKCVDVRDLTSRESVLWSPVSCDSPNLNHSVNYRATNKSSCEEKMRNVHMMKCFNFENPDTQSSVNDSSAYEPYHHQTSSVNCVVTSLLNDEFLNLKVSDGNHALLNNIEKDNVDRSIRSTEQIAPETVNDSDRPTTLSENSNTATEVSIFHSVSARDNVPIEKSVSVDYHNAREKSRPENLFLRTVGQIAEIRRRQSIRYLVFEPLDKVPFFQIDSEVSSKYPVFPSNVRVFGSLDRIPRDDIIPNKMFISDMLNYSHSNLWKCRSEEMLSLLSSQGCCTSDMPFGGIETFCRLRRSKALSKANTAKSITNHPASASAVEAETIMTNTAKETISNKSSVHDKNVFHSSNHIHPSRKSPSDHVAIQKIQPPSKSFSASAEVDAINNNLSKQPSFPKIGDTDIVNCVSLKSKDKKKTIGKKKAGITATNPMQATSSKHQTLLGAMGQVPRPLVGNTPVPKPLNSRGTTDTKTGGNKGHLRSRSSRIPRKQQHGHEGRPIVPPKPIRPPMWLSKAELTQEIQHLSTLCESRTKELNKLKMQTKHVTRGFDALAITIKYMFEDLKAIENPCLVSNLKQTQEKVDKEKKDLECYEQKIVVLNNLHAKEMSDLLETLTQRHESELQELIMKQTAESNFLQEQHKREIISFTEALKASCDEERLQQEKLIEDLRKELKQQREEVEMFHQQELDDLEERHIEKEKALREEIKKLQKQLSDAKQSSCTMEEALQKDTDSKLHWLSEKKNDLQKEVDSLKAVLEIKNNELHSLRKENLEMQKELEDLPLAKEKIKMLQARAEDLQALMSDKVQLERQLSTEHKIAKENYEKEAKVSKRLSMENEELQWRLRQLNEQALLCSSVGELYEETPPEETQASDPPSEYDEELTPAFKTSSPLSSSSRPMFFTYMNEEELALSSHSPRMHYKQIKPCTSSHKSSPVKPFKSSSTPSPRKSKGSTDSSPHCGGGTPRKVAKHISRAAQRSAKQKAVSNNVEEKTRTGSSASEHLEVNLLGFADSMVSSASSDNSVFEPCLLEEHGEEIRETLKLLQEQKNTELIYGISSPSYDSKNKWHITSEVITNEDATTDQNDPSESIDPKTFYHVAFPVLKESESAQDVEPERVAKEGLSDCENK